MTGKIFLLSVLLAGAAAAETNKAFRLSFPRWASSLRGGTVYNFDADLKDAAGAFSVNRFVAEAMLGYMWDTDTFCALTVGGGQDDYHFSDTGSDPWNNINNYRVGIYGRWSMSEQWAFFVSPSVRSYAEAGADPLDGLTASFFGGASYAFSDRLSLGPALVVVGQIEDSVRYFPAVLVNWTITENLSLNTGGGLAITTGPGLAMVYKLSNHWKIGLTGRYERKRFRLNNAEEGVGEDRNVPIYGTLSYFLYPQGYVTAVLGFNTSGKLGLYDSGGNLSSETEYDPSFSLGFVASFRF